MIQSQNQTKAQFQELEQKIENSFDDIFNTTSYPIKEIPKFQSQLNSEIMNFILRFSNDLQIEMAINFIRILKKLVQIHIEDQIIPLFNNLNFYDQTNGCSKLECFIEMYQKYIKKSKYLLTSLYFAINLIYPKNPQEALKDYLDYLLLQKLCSTNILKQLFECFLQQIDAAYYLIQKNQDSSWKQIGNTLKQFGDIFINLQKEQANNNIDLQFTNVVLTHFKNKYQEFYNKWAQEYKIPFYLRKVKMQKEYNNQILNFDDNSIRLQINSQLEEQLLQNFKDFILSDNIPFNLESLLENFNSENLEIQDDLGLLNELYLTLDPNDQDIKMKIKQKILQEGNLIFQIINNQEVNKQLSHRFVISLFQLHQKYHKIIQICLNQNTYIQSLLTNAFEELLNFSDQKLDFQEYFVLFIEQEIENVINNQNDNQYLGDTVQLLLYLSEKNDFTVYYQNRLAQRLLKYYRILSSTEFYQVYLKTESIIIQKMSSLMGNQSIYPLELMIEEFSKSRETIFEFKIENNKQLIVQHPLLLKQSDWPKFQYQQIELNEEFFIIGKLKQKFESQQDQKLINWLDLLSYVDIEYSKKQITLRINIPQAIILFAYQYKNEFLSTKMISQITKLQEYLIIQNCLEMKASNILEEVVIDNEKLYRFNEEWEELEDSKINKIIITNTQIPILYLKKAKSKRNLNLPMEAFILKTLKIKKTILFQDLVENVKQYTKNTFNEDIQVDQISTIIKNLYERNYLDIDASNPELLKYV
ncbi:unnamed protein product [Paramecium pentaurelia]|uniref:Cullin family profile domain-containing protein n=1 Tax=Paramecium pentaurelia TaxID=43138 RepID=A0A8S1YF32_9CILI|nr:unnamed protein product [Paramecium pentaurelia]